MHLLRTSLLRNQLRDNTLSERDSVKYMLVASVLYTYTMYSAGWFGGYRHWSALFEAAVVVLIGLFGTYECFRANGGDAGQDFLRRFSALSVPLGVKFAVLGLVVAQAMYYGAPFILTPASFRDPEFVYRLLWFVLSLALAIGFYARLVYHISLCAKPLQQLPNAA